MCSAQGSRGPALAEPAQPPLGGVHGRRHAALRGRRPRVGNVSLDPYRSCESVLRCAYCRYGYADFDRLWGP